jgi:hypothetical protein
MVAPCGASSSSPAKTPSTEAAAAREAPGAGAGAGSEWDDGSEVGAVASVNVTGVKVADAWCVGSVSAAHASWWTHGVSAVVGVSASCALSGGGGGGGAPRECARPAHTSTPPPFSQTHRSLAPAPPCNPTPRGVSKVAAASDEEEIKKKIAAKQNKCVELGFGVPPPPRPTGTPFPSPAPLPLPPLPRSPFTREELLSVIKKHKKGKGAAAAAAPEPAPAPPVALTWREKQAQRKLGGGGSASAGGASVSVTDEAQFPRLGGSKAPAPSASEAALANNCWKAVAIVGAVRSTRHCPLPPPSPSPTPHDSIAHPPAPLCHPLPV